LKPPARDQERHSSSRCSAPIAGVERRRREIQQRPDHALGIAAFLEQVQRAFAELDRAREIAVQPRREADVVQRAADIRAILELRPDRA
jgi:hypothetical protein